jgi:HD-like signal output (HDOD) protein
MMDIGKIIIAKELIDSKKSTKFKDELQNISTTNELSKLEIDMVGISSQMVTAQIFKNWNLEPEIAEVIKYSLNPIDAPENLKKHCYILSVISNSVNVFGTLLPDQLNSTTELLKLYNLDAQLFFSAIEKVQH